MTDLPTDTSAASGSAGSGRASKAVVVIYNPASGNAPGEDGLREALGDDVELVPTTEDDPGTGQARAAIDNGAEVVVASGGDGTVRAVMEALVGSDTALGILPFGTGNLLASSLDVPAGLDAWAAVDERRLRRIDTGTANGEAFANMAGIGFDADMLADASSRWKDRVGVAAYVAAALRHVRDPLTDTTITIDGSTWFRGRSAMVLVGNFGTISGGISVLPDADPADGRLDVLVLSTSTVRDWLAVSWRMLRGRSFDGVAAERTQGQSIVVTTDRERRWEIDGEEREPTREVSFDVVADSLSVVEGSNQ